MGTDLTLTLPVRRSRSLGPTRMHRSGSKPLSREEIGSTFLREHATGRVRLSRACVCRLLQICFWSLSYPLSRERGAVQMTHVLGLAKHLYSLVLAYVYGVDRRIAIA